MRIDFFEEYPTRENLTKARALKHPATIYLAANSLLDFFSCSEILRGINPKLEPAYWPTTKSSYWVSPFTDPSDLEKLKTELFIPRTTSLKVLIDLELPFLHPKLFIKNLPTFHKNKKLITSFFEDSHKHNLHLCTAEWPPIGPFSETMLEKIGMHYSPHKYHHHIIDMYYSSLEGKKLLRHFKKAYLLTRNEKFTKHHQVGLGCIAHGNLKFEPLLSPNNLDEDLNFLQRSGIKEATIFRLGGINEAYMEVISKYI